MPGPLDGGLVFLVFPAVGRVESHQETAPLDGVLTADGALLQFGGEAGVGGDGGGTLGGARRDGGAVGGLRLGSLKIDLETFATTRIRLREFFFGLKK